MVGSASEAGQLLKTPRTSTTTASLSSLWGSRTWPWVVIWAFTRLIYSLMRAPSTWLTAEETLAAGCTAAPLNLVQ
jgi:hypothetical protein